jgi:hypothetical protein
MTVRKLSPTGDFTFGNSQLNFLSDSPEAVAQVVQTSFLLWLGEWFLDVTAGMPWIQGVLGKHNQATADVTVQDYLLGVPDVTNIESFTSVTNENRRLYTASARINTTFGPTDVQIANQTLF